MREKVLREKDALPNISPLDVVSYILNIKKYSFQELGQTEMSLCPAAKLENKYFLFHF